MNAMLLLSLQLEWGADEALGPDPVSRLLRPAGIAEAAPGALAAPRPVASAMPDRFPSRPVAPVPDPLPSHPVAPVPDQLPSHPAGSAAPVAVDPPFGAATQPAPSMPPPARAPAAARATTVLPARGPAVEARALSEAATDLDALRAVIAGFTGCTLRDTATRSVLPTGNPAGGIAIVGEVPDEDEDRAGHPFAGRAGDLLDRMLGSIGVHRRDCLLLPLIPWRPPGSRAPSPIELSVCQPFLERALHLAAPSIVLCMGSRPARTVAASTIRAGAGWRAPALSGLPDGARALAMRHPSYLLSHLPARRDAWADLIRVRRALDERERASITDT